MKRIIRGHMHALAFGLAASALAAAPAAAATAVRDATGRTVEIRDNSRIVSIGGAVTEILYALGADKQIVGVDTTSLFPLRAMKEKPNVGYMRQLSPEGVLGLKPTLILAVEGAGPKEVVSILRSAGIPMVQVPDPYTGEGIIEKIRIVAEAAGLKSRGECLAAAVRKDLDALRELRARIARPARAVFVLSFVNGRAMVAGARTAADGIIRMAGAENAVTGYDGYKPINDEAMVAARPEAVIAMKRGAADTMNAADVFGHAAFKASPAAASGAFLPMDGLYLLGFGPRTALAARDIATALHPGLKGSALPSESLPAAAKACAE